LPSPHYAWRVERRQNCGWSDARLRRVSEFASSVWL